MEDEVCMSELPLPTDAFRSETCRSKRALGVLASEEMLDRGEALLGSCRGLLLLQLEDSERSDPGGDSESDEKSRESVRPASAMRRRRRSAVPSRLQPHAIYGC